MTPDELAAELRPYVAARVPGGGEQFLDLLLDKAKGGEVLELVHAAETALNDEHADRQVILEALIDDVRRVFRPGPEQRVRVDLFKPSGKWYTEEDWRIPQWVHDHSPQRGAFKRRPIGPYDMAQSPDFRRIDGGPVLVPSQDPWGYPHLFPGE